MAEIKPFAPLRYTQRGGSIETLVSPPYDIVSAEQRDALLKLNPYNIIGVELPQGEGEAKYRAAAKLLESFRSDGVLKEDDESSIFIYSEEFPSEGGKKTVYGIIGRVTLHEFSERIILPHEETLTKAKQDRFDLMCATCANISPIYALYNDDSNAIDLILKRYMTAAPLACFTDKDGITHRLHRIPAGKDTDAIAATLAPLRLFIADGHHRYETALRYKKHLAAAGELESTAADSQMMLLVEMKNPGLVVFPTHRLVNPRAAIDPQEIVNRASEYFDVEALEGDPAEALSHFGTRPGCFVLCAPGKRFLFKLRDPSVMRRLLPDMSEAYATLDVTILHSLVLESLLGIDKEDMAAGRSLTYTRDTAEAAAAPEEGKCAFSFILRATLVSQIRDVSLAGEKMPQKSTYFHPKPVTGLVINDFRSLK